MTKKKPPVKAIQPRGVWVCICSSAYNPRSGRLTSLPNEVTSESARETFDLDRLPANNRINVCRQRLRPIRKMVRH
jgi:hypothetical protein